MIFPIIQHIPVLGNKGGKGSVDLGINLFQMAGTFRNNAFMNYMENNVLYPAQYDEVICIGAVDKDYNIFSSFASPAMIPHIAVPCATSLFSFVWTILLDIINISVGCLKESKELKSVINKAIDKDIIVIASGGNYMENKSISLIKFIPVK